MRHVAGPPPLVVITTNEERQLPSAFLRRCLVLKIRLLPDDSPELITFLMERGGHHFPAVGASIREEAAVQLCRDRREARGFGTPPGQAEYLDILRALDRMAPGDETEQANTLGRIAVFALRKAPREL